MDEQHVDKTPGDDAIDQKPLQGSLSRPVPVTFPESATAASEPAALAADAGTTALVPAEFPQTRQGIEDLRTRLNAAYEAAAGPTAADTREAIDQMLDGVDDMLRELAAEEMAARDGAMQAATAEVKGPVDRLTELKEALNRVSRGIVEVNSAVEAADQAITLWKSCFSM